MEKFLDFTKESGADLGRGWCILESRRGQKFQIGGTRESMVGKVN
jgi:hypothetical protein